MSTFCYEGEHRFYFGAQARLLDNARETASEWAAAHMLYNPAHSFVLGKFVEADRPNNNKQYFSLAGLQVAKPTITNAPMNMNHSSRNIVGSFIASEMIYPTSEQSAENPLNPYIESLGCFWRYYFPEEYRLVQRAHEEGSLFYSMEAVPSGVSTIGGADDNKIYPYEGKTSPNYPEEINKRTVPAILLHEPHFVGGALIIPPVKPGWNRADVSQISSLMNTGFHEAEMAYEGIAETAPHLDPQTWEDVMNEILFMEYEAEEARDFSDKQRKKLAGTGHALPDGSFPIKNGGDLANAIKLAGKAKDPGKAKSHIKKMAKALGLESKIPDGW